MHYTTQHYAGNDPKDVMLCVDVLMVAYHIMVAYNIMVADIVSANIIYPLSGIDILCWQYMNLLSVYI